jgi:hypothetical protein
MQQQLLRKNKWQICQQLTFDFAALMIQHVNRANNL